MQVCFVALPFQNIEHPVLSLSILQGCLQQKHISSQILYANMDYATLIGLRAYYAIAHSGSFREALMGEFVFSQAAFQQSAKGYLEFLHTELAEFMSEQALTELLSYLTQAEQAAQHFLQSTVDKVLQSKPLIVACSSTTQQNCVCLAFLRLLKEQAPHIITVMGGPNCERVMGRTLADSFPWVDYIVSGEADSFWADFCCKLLDGQREFPEYPIFNITNQLSSESAGLTERLDNIPYPNFDDYFAALQNFPYAAEVNTGLLIETSRGCWWGESNPCTFCGLNGASRTYRTKSSLRVLSEFEFLSTRYNCQRFFAVDCILAQEFWETVLPQLANLNLQIMYEVKTNLSYKQILMLRTAGINWVQPGIESLQDDLLQLINKGNRAIKHVELLKRLTELGIKCCWLLLCGFPHEQPLSYQEQLATMRLITHLQPPDAVFRLRYDRFSLYEQNAAAYGLELDAAPAYFYIYPQQYHEHLKDLAYFMVDVHRKQPVYAQGFTEQVHKDNYQFVEQWRQTFYSPFKDRLTAKLVSGVLEVIDLRSCATGSFHSLTGCELQVALAARQVIDQQALQAGLATDYSAQQVTQALISLLQKRLVLQIGHEVLFLPLEVECALPDATDPPAGSIRQTAFDRR